MRDSLHFCTMKTVDRIHLEMIFFLKTISGIFSIDPAVSPVGWGWVRSSVKYRSGKRWPSQAVSQISFFSVV